MKLKFNKKIILGLISISALCGVVFANAKDVGVSKNSTKAVSSRIAENSLPSQTKIYSVPGSKNICNYIQTSGGKIYFARKKLKGSELDVFCMDKDKWSPTEGVGDEYYLQPDVLSEKVLYALECDTKMNNDSDGYKEYFVRSMSVHYAVGQYHITLAKGSKAKTPADENIMKQCLAIARTIDGGNYKTTQDVTTSLSPTNITLTQNGSNYESNWININVNGPSGLKYSPVLKQSIVNISGAPSGTQVIRSNGSVASGNNIGTDTRFWVKIPIGSISGDVKITVSVTSTFEVGVARYYKGNSAKQPLCVRATKDKTVTTGSISSGTITGGGKVVVTKKGDDGKLLSGASFQLKSATTTTNIQTTSDNGTITFTNVPAGTYTLVETSTPWGYVNPGNKTVTVTAGQTTNVTVVNPRAKGNLKVVKKDEEGKRLAGAKFQLQLGSSVVAGPLTTDVNGEVTFSNMPIGGYSLVEISAPVGHVVDSATNYRIVEVPHNQTSVVEVVNKTVRGSIQVTKLDSLDDRKLSGAVFTLYNSSGVAVDETITDSSGVGIFKNVKYGEYTVKETKAPIGYVLNPEPISFNVTTDGGIYYGDIYDNRERDITIPSYNVKNDLGEIVGTLEKNKSYEFNVEIKNEYTNLKFPAGTTVGTPIIEKIKYATAVNDGTINQDISSITTSNIKGTIIPSGTGSKTNVPIKDLSSNWQKIKFTTPNDDSYSEIVFVVEVECSKDSNPTNNRLVVKLPITNKRKDAINIVNMEVYPSESGAALVGNDVNVMVDVTSNSLKSYDVKSSITIKGPEGFGTKVIEKPIYGVSLENPGKVYFKFEPTKVGSYTITSTAEIPGSSSKSESKQISVVYPSSPDVYADKTNRTQISRNEGVNIKTYVKVKKRDKDKLEVEYCDDECQTDNVTGDKICPGHEVWVWGDWYDAFVPRKETPMTGITEKFNITELKFRSKFTENNIEKYPLAIDTDGYVDLLNPNSAKYAQVKAGYGFDIKAKTEYTNNLPQIFERGYVSNGVPNNTRWSEYKMIAYSGDKIPFIYADTPLKNVDSQVSSYSGVVSVTVPSLSDLIIESPNQLYMKLPDGSGEYCMVNEGYGQRFSSDKIKQNLLMTNSIRPMITNTEYSEVKEFEFKKDNSNSLDKRGYYIGKNVKDGVNEISFYNRYAGYGLNNNTRLHDNKTAKVKVYGGRYDDLKGTNN